MTLTNREIFESYKLVFFQFDEFPADPVEFMDPELLLKLDLFRAAVGAPVFVTPVVAGMYREGDENKYSQHYYEKDKRKSKAIDVFTRADPLHAYLTALNCGLFGGVGVYFDTYFRNQPSVMLHLDIRDRIKHQSGLFCSTATTWMRASSSYLSISTNPDIFCDHMAKFVL